MRGPGKRGRRGQCGSRALGNERGAALLMVTFILVIVLVGGLAAISITSGELGNSRGFRSRAATESCAQAALEHIRTLLPNNTGSVSVDISLGAGNTLHYQGGHYSSSPATTLFTELPATAGAFGSSFDGTNLTNALALGGGGGDLSKGVHFVTTTATCKGPGFGEREVQLVLRYGLPSQ